MVRHAFRLSPRTARTRRLRVSRAWCGAFAAVLLGGTLAAAPGAFAGDADVVPPLGKPAHPRGVTLTLGNTSGIVGGYRVVMENTVSVSGFAKAGSRIVIFMNGEAVAEATAASAGRFAKTFKLDAGFYVFTARAKAPNGKVSTSGNLRVQVASPALVRLDELTASEGFSITNVKFDWIYERPAASPAGDLNCDGYADLYLHRVPQGSKLLPAAVLFGRAGGFPRTIALEDIGTLAGFEIIAPKDSGPAVSVQAIRDFDGDGCSDLALHYDIESFRTPNQTVVLYGRAEGFPASVPVDALTADEAFRITGDFAVHRQTAGDFNADALGDLALSSPYARGKGFGNDQGVTHVVFGQSRPSDGHVDLDALDGENGFRIIGVRGSQSGEAIASVDGFSGNRIDDLLIGAPEGRDLGRGAQILFGQPDGFPRTVQLVARPQAGTALGPDRASKGFGAFAASAGDFNGDGFGDALVGTREPLEGAYLVFGRRNPPSSSVVTDLPPPSTVRLFHRDTYDFNFALAALGDVSGDGRDDIAIGIDSGTAVSGPFWAGGAVYILNGRKKAISSSIDLAFLPPNLGTLIVGPADAFGRKRMSGIGKHVSNAGDVNGDGVNDILLTVEEVGGESSDVGAIYVIYGKRPEKAPATGKP